MQIAKISVSGNRAEAGPLEMITAGTIGATVAFEFDETWDGMCKILVWRGSGRTIDDTTCSGVVPPEVISEAGYNLLVGVYGTRDGNATPTLWVNLGRVMDAADPSGDESTDPSLPVWAQVLENVGEVKENSNQAKAAAGRAEELASLADAAAKDAMVVAEQAAVTAQGAVAVAEQAESIAKGRATGYVFDTVEDLDLWLSNEANTEKLQLGDNFYIRTVDVPDYWWDGTQKQVLETQKVDLREYVKKTQYVTEETAGLCRVAGFNTGKWGLIKANQEAVPGGFLVCCATEADIDKRENDYKPIVSGHLDYAVKRGVAYNAKTMTEAEKKSACKWFGTLNVVENSDGSITVTMPSGKTKTVDLSKIEIFL